MKTEPWNQFFSKTIFKEKIMNNKKILMLILLVTLLSALPMADLYAGSIWAKRDKGIKELYADDIARNIGDVLTIKITEDSKVDNKAKRDLNKTTGRESTFNGNLNIDHILPSIPGFTMKAETANNLSSKADYKDERSFVDRVTVVVIDVLPNQNLVVLGTRNRNIGGDIQIIEVSGIVRPSDIAFDNTVKSEQVANFCIVSRNSGVSATYTKPGWLGRIFDIIWPF
jgi:flagellar L-ring protein precursor FlgH